MPTLHLRHLPGALALCLAGVLAHGAAAADVSQRFYDAALCQPPYTTASATALYEAAEKLAKPDMSMLTAAVYALPKPIGRDGFDSNEVIFAGSSVGVLVQGEQADALAARYKLQRESSTLLGTSTKGYSRALPDAQQPLPDAGTVSIVARESRGLPGKTLLACEFVSNADRDALKAYEKSVNP
ncbi:hypothetical protein [Labrys wisconsinensis]